MPKRVNENDLAKVLLKTVIPYRSYHVLRKYAAKHFDGDMNRLMLDYWTFPSLYNDLREQLFEVEMKSAMRLVDELIHAKSVEDND